MAAVHILSVAAGKMLADHKVVAVMAVDFATGSTRRSARVSTVDLSAENLSSNLVMVLAVEETRVAVGYSL